MVVDHGSYNIITYTGQKGKKKRKAKVKEEINDITLH